MVSDSTAVDAATFSSKNGGTSRLLILATLQISCLASSVLPLPSSHLADSGRNLSQKQRKLVVKLPVLERWATKFSSYQM